MTLNNLAEQLPWLLRNPQSTHPASASSSRSTVPAFLATPSSTALAPSFSSSARKDPAPSSVPAGTTTPRVANLGLPTPTSTASTFLAGLRPTPYADPDVHDRRRLDTPGRPGGQPPSFPRSEIAPPPSVLPTVAESMTPNVTNQQRRQPQVAQVAPSVKRGIETPSHGKNGRLAVPVSSSKTPSRHPGSASNARKAKTPAAPSPYAFNFGSDDFNDVDADAFVDLTTDGGTTSSSSPGLAPRDDIHLGREDGASRPEPLLKRGKKRKSGGISGSPSKKAVGKTQEESGQDEASIMDDFPDVNDLVGLSSPITLHRAAALNCPRKPSPKPAEPLETMTKVTTPAKKQKLQPTRSDIVMDSEDEFVTPPTRNASFVTCPADISACDDEPPSPHSPDLRTSSRVADTPFRKQPESQAPKVLLKANVVEQAANNGDGDVDMNKTEPVSAAADSTSMGASLPAKETTTDPAPGEEEDQEDAESTQRPSIFSYWPALRWKQHCINEKIRKNTADYMNALREKWSQPRRMQIKGEKEPLLKEKQPLDRLVDEIKAYAALHSEQETLINSITEAYQNHQDTEAEEARLDDLSQELQDQEELLRAQLSEEAIDPTSCPSDFDAGSPHNIVVPATQHPENFVTPILSRNSTFTPNNPSQVVPQTQIPAPQQHSRPAAGTFESVAGGFSTPRMPPTLPRIPNRDARHAAIDSQPDYFDDEDLFADVGHLPPMLGSASGSRSARAQNHNTQRRSPLNHAPATTRGQDVFSDYSDDIEMLQVAEDFEQQHSSGGEMPPRPGPSRQALAPTSGNLSMAPRATSTSTSTSTSTNNSKRPAQPVKKAVIPPELMCFDWSQDVRRALKDRFRMSGFRHNQLEAINATLSGKDAFVLMPTGGGKSLCYQLPAVISSGQTSGVTIVISPLLSLMQDQVDHLKALNIAASAFNSSTPAAARKHILALFSKPNPDHFLQLLYVTPEMVSKSNQFCNGLEALYRNKKLARMVIDEAHCVSQWGHDFRPDYKALGEVRRRFPRVPVMALTATATPNVIVDIQHNLSIEGCKVFSQSFNRPNLYYEIREKGKGVIDSIADLITSRYNGQTGIVYTLSQKSTVSIAEKLQSKGISAHHYHAGINADEKAQIQRDWQSGRIKIVVATIAFGMGIDKPDVRFVIHHYLPKSLEGYYQETGRAGRDGAHSDCFLYFSYGDIKNLRKFIADSEGSEAQKDRQREMLNRMIDFCENKRDCRRAEILRYFGENFDHAGCAGTCDNCKNGGKFDLADFTDYAVAALRVVQEYELITMIQCGDILQGKRRPEAQHSSLLDIYGIAKGLKKHEVHMMIYRLLGEDALREENKVNRMDIAIQYFSLGRSAREFLSGKKRLQVVTKVGGDIGAAVTERPTKKAKAPARSADVADQAGKKSSKTAKATAGDGQATSASRKKGKGVAAFVLDQADDEDDVDGGGGGDDDDDFERFQGPLHANGYAKDNFVVSDNDDDFDTFSPPRRSVQSKTRSVQLQQYTYQNQPARGKGQQQQRQRRLEELGGPIAQDPRLAEANIDPIHADIIAAFVDEARRTEEKIRNEKGLRILFTESHLREMAIGWTDTLDKMRQIRDVDADHVRRFGARFVPLVKRYFSMYQEMMGVGQAAPSRAAAGPSQADLDAVVDLISSDDEEYNGGVESAMDEDDSHFGANASATNSNEAAQWRAQLESLQSQPSGKSGGGGGRASGGSRKSWGSGGGKRSFRRGGSSSRSGGFRSRAASGAGGSGVSKRKSTASAASGGGSRASGGGRKGGASSSSRGGGSGIGVMPL